MSDRTGAGPRETNDGFRRGRHVVSAMHVHLVFVTTYRRGVFNDEIVRHEVLCDRVEVRDHHHRAVAAAR
ncbi:hypothetical protein FCI23_30550 [Actinacidiphila oryziradicis]|uniref:Transposase IS200-like domain-containing protein n=1 Tax=Actinacidiphila oryziradicis TaxID=2571141 RepID=A0A4V5MZ31_9ACTN|nr:hypothetical protein FCI23_30550 [Actinacidiphila oryziradicis]